MNLAAAAKRVLDVFGALLALGLLWPVMLVIGIAIRINMGSPILFRQRRPGRNAVAFNLYKFRTMLDGPGSDGQRLTPLGKMLRATSLDELPEFWNVLKGEMSLVGPRPLLMQYLEEYTEEQARRHRLRPGLTGLAQINGRNALDWETKLQFDVWYVEHWSLWLDLKILLLTPMLVLRQYGVSKRDHATTNVFTRSKS